MIELMYLRTIQYLVSIDYECISSIQLLWGKFYRKCLTLMEEDKSMSTHLRTVLLTLLVSASGNALANNDQVFSGIHSFGTSLSDEGNAFIICGMQSVPPYDNLTEDNLYVTPGDSPYARGGITLVMDLRGSNHLRNHWV